MYLDYHASVLARANDFVSVDNFYYTPTRVGVGMTLNVLRKERDSHAVTPIQLPTRSFKFPASLQVLIFLRCDLKVNCTARAVNTYEARLFALHFITGRHTKITSVQLSFL
jgi:hypothetical protein